MIVSMLATIVRLPAALQKPDLPFVAPVFSSNMVLQRDVNAPVWGWTRPGETVKVKIDGKTVQAVADGDGKWIVRLPRFSAGGNYELDVTGTKNAAFNNVTFGDVWICSGQSNMEFGVGNLLNPEAEIAGANIPNLRLYAMPKLIALSPTGGVGGTWKVCTPENLGKDGDWNGFSAVAYFFGRKLVQDLKVPIGLIHTSWGGTIAEAWTPANWLHRQLPEFDAAIHALDLQRQQRESAGQASAADQLSAWYEKNDPGSAGGVAWADPALNDADWHTAAAPGFFQKSGFPEFNNQQSVVWYRKQVDLTAEQAAKDATLHFFADDNDKTFLNGVAIGATDGYNVNRAYKVPTGVLHEGKNMIAIRVTDTSQPGGVYGEPDTLFIDFADGSKLPLAGDWKIKLGVAIGSQIPLPSTSDNDPNHPTVLYNGMIAPLTPYAVKGAIWYQGESNVGRAKQYQTLLPTLIESWREAFQSGDFPFLIVQLAGFQHPPAEPGEDGWADLRDAQMIASRAVKNGGVATAIDIGDENDIHPKNKQEVGRRLALLAESKIYHQHVTGEGPVYRSIKLTGNAAIIQFEHANGLKTADAGPVKGFAIASADRKWHWAQARIEGDHVLVSSPDVQSPVAVRYGWAAYLDLNLQNGDGLPAYPFRTDNWSGN